jgi:Do/DeqQ family serine protease
VIVDPGGIVVSNAHVVGGADEITVVLSDRREFEAEVILIDEDTDLAVMRLDGARDLPVLELRDSDTLEVGDLVLAIGNPFGVGQTVTSGIVSGLARGTDARDARGGYFIQTDAPINPGNSGGALVDMRGRLAGVNTAILSRSGGSNGVGFAIPSNLVARLIEAAQTGAGELARPWLGLSAQAVTADMAEALGLARPEGVLVGALHAASPLARAGIAQGDVILALGGEPVNAPAELDFRAATLGTGARAEVVFLSRDEQRVAEVALAEAPDEPPRDQRLLARAGALTGLVAMRVNPAVIEELGLPVTARGVVVERVQGPARRSGLEPGDLILAVNGEPVESPRALERAVSRAGEIVLRVQRGDRRGRVRVVN